MKSEQRSFVIYRRNTYEQYGGYDLFQTAEFKANVLAESCVMFFSPSRAVLNAILRDEYLTSAARTKEGDSFFSSNRRGQIFISENIAYILFY